MLQTLWRSKLLQKVLLNTEKEKNKQCLLGDIVQTQVSVSWSRNKLLLKGDVDLSSFQLSSGSLILSAQATTLLVPPLTAAPLADGDNGESSTWDHLHRDMDSRAGKAQSHHVPWEGDR